MNCKICNTEINGNTVSWCGNKVHPECKAKKDAENTAKANTPFSQKLHRETMKIYHVTEDVKKRFGSVENENDERELKRQINEALDFYGLIDE